ncbi:MAG TPA: hypothetical protein VES02_00040 [Dermatophilaceae bacterium]|nr:hypothetical protein [Dermatophilaceae bacterium]
MPLDRTGTMSTVRITDTDGDRLDRGTSYDRALGPMQFIPGTWRLVGSDPNEDGRKNPQDLADAASATRSLPRSMRVRDGSMVEVTGSSPRARR